MLYKKSCRFSSFSAIGRLCLLSRLRAWVLVWCLKISVRFEWEILYMLWLVRQSWHRSPVLVRLWGKRLSLYWVWNLYDLSAETLVQWVFFPQLLPGWYLPFPRTNTFKWTYHWNNWVNLRFATTRISFLWNPLRRFFYSRLHSLCRSRCAYETSLVFVCYWAATILKNSAI